ncbi:stAR-related lipid transfer protein 7, mitochondrial-like isoform X1 [Cimex lectularius]|uniref:Phosphatidylcholine transfer protein n=1 Tax=Cimex lectularius TaxID=79782 RepID=A0A8I6SC68_CIMLE|nr:stAR-related lipid transfer protein 7, mitochondrial-like isoform X1 [Cimex lectularius]
MHTMRRAANRALQHWRLDRLRQKAGIHDLERLSRFRHLFSGVPRLLRFNSACVMRSCVAQVEFVIAFRIRRGVQVLSFYSGHWDQLTVLRLLHRVKLFLLTRTRDALIAAVSYKFDWDANRITETELHTHSKEFETCTKLLKDCTDPKGPGCAEGVPTEHGWVRVILQDNISIWKKEVRSGLYTYKVYAKYSDVTAADFFSLYLDIENRTKWDAHAIILKIIDSEVETNSDIIYWETKWPTFFANRDYVYNRRWMIDRNKNVMVIKSKSTQHPDGPPIPGKARVVEYWSYVVIKPFKDFEEPGLEFCLTYFDNHGASVPNSLSQWVTVSGVPDYVNRLRAEALFLKKQREANKKKIKPEKIVDEDDENRRREAEEPPSEPPEDGDFPKPDPAFLILFTIMEKVKNASSKVQLV